MASRKHLLITALVGALVATAVTAGAAQAATVPKVGGLTANGSNLVTAKLGVKWSKVTGASYQVRWASSTAALSKAKVYATTKTSALSPALGNVCLTWYAQVRAKKSGKYGAWSTAKALKFSGTSGVPAATPITTGQTSTSSAQVRWTKVPGAAGYRAHYSPAPYGNWPGYFPYTSTTPYTSSGLSIALPTVAAAGDRFMAPQYGNPLFFQLETKRCSGTYAKAQFGLVFPKALPPGDATTGDALAFGSYNVELFPTAADAATKMVNLADNIAAANLDVVTLQEASKQTSIDLVAQLAATEGQADWAYATIGNTSGVNQQILFRTGKYTEVSSTNIGNATDGTAATPLATPLAQLAPTDPDPKLQDIIVVGVHLEDRTKFFPTATIPERKADASAAATVLLNNIAANNPTGLPVLAAGDYKGNFGGGGAATDGYCDESSTPSCTGEGQPTFIRGGFIDAQGAVTKVGIQYGTVNKHVANQPAGNSGFGGRADFILLKGFTGTSRYENVRKAYGDASATYQSDHNLIFANVFVPFVATP